MLNIARDTFDDLTLASLAARTRTFLVEQSPSFAQTDAEFQQTFVAVQATQMEAFGLTSMRALPTLALAAWELGVVDFAAHADLSSALLAPATASEDARLTRFGDLVAQELQRRAENRSRTH